MCQRCLVCPDVWVSWLLAKASRVAGLVPGPPLLLQLLTSEPLKAQTEERWLVSPVVVTLASPSGRKQNRVAGDSVQSSTLLPAGGAPTLCRERGSSGRRVAVTSRPLLFPRSVKQTGCSALFSLSLERMTKQTSSPEQDDSN